MSVVHLDYVAGNVRSLANAIQKVEYQVEWIKSPDDIKNSEVRVHQTPIMKLLTVDTHFAWGWPLWALRASPSFPKGDTLNPFDNILY